MMHSFTKYNQFQYSPYGTGGGRYLPTQKTNGRTNTELAGSVEKLTKVNGDLQQSRRAALNLMEDAILSKEALRISEEKYRTLFDSMDEGYCIIQMMYDGEGKAYNWRFIEVNNAFELNNGLHEAEGKTILELAPDIEPKWVKIYDSVAQTGEPLRFEEDSAALKRIFSLYAFRIGKPHDHRVAVIFNDISERKKVEKILRDSEERKAFLLKLSDALRPIADPIRVHEIMTRLAMDHFAADRCYYCEIENGWSIIRRDAARDGLPSVSGVSTSLDSIPLFKSVLDAGKPFVVHDVNTRDLVDESLRQLYIKLQVNSFINIPVIKEGKPVGLFCIVQSVPRDWTNLEVELSQEVAERTWAAVERAKVEEAIRESEERKKFLLKLNDTIRQLNDPVDIEYEAARLVAEQLEADRVHFSEIIEDGKLMVRKDYVRGDVPSIAGVYKSKVIAAAIILDRDEPVIIADVQAFPLLGDEDKAALTAARIRSQLSVALSRQGKQVASFAVDHTTPREWTPLEISILQEAAERTLAAVEKAKAEEALRVSEEGQAFMLQLTDALRTLGSSASIEQEACRLVGDRLDADHTFYCELDVANDYGAVKHDHVRNGATPLVADYRVSDLGFVIPLHKLGKPVVVDDVFASQLIPDADRAAIAASHVAWISVPLIKNNVLVGSFCVAMRGTRNWSDREAELVAETAERVSAAIERARAEEALRINEKRIRIQKESFLSAINGEPLESSLNILAQMVKEEIGSEVRTAFYMAYHDATRLYGIPASGDMPEAYIKQVNVWPVGEESSAYGPSTGIGQRVLTRNVFEEPLWNNSTHLAKEHQFSACGSFPIYTREGKPIGTFAMYFNAVHDFTPQELAVAEAVTHAAAIIISRHKEVQERALAEEALHKSEERFRILADAVPQVIWTNGANGQADYFNQRWYEYTGLHYEQSAGPGWQAVVHPEDAPASVEKWNQALAAGVIFDTEYRLRRHDGLYSWFIGRNVPLKDTTGKITGWFGSATDINDLKKVQYALSRTEERLRVTINSAIDYAIINSDTEGSIVGWNSGAERIFQYTDNEVTGRSASIIFIEEDREAGAPDKEMQTAREEGKAADERWHERKDGSRFFMSGMMHPIYDLDKLAGYVKIGRDMTEQKNAEERLKILEERYRIALMSAEMGAWDWNVISDKVVWNDQHYIILGMDPGQAVRDASDFLHFVHEDDRELVREALRRAVEETDVYQAEFRIKRADNDEIRWMNGYARTVKKEAGRASRMVGVMFDITNRKKMEQQKDDFIGIASHELKTPVTSIKGYAQILQQMFTEENNPHSAILMEKLDVQVDRLTDLICSLLDTTKISEGQLVLNYESVDINALIKEELKDLNYVSQRHELVFKAGHIKNIIGDKERLGQVITNLVTNAIKYSPNGGNVTITTIAVEYGVQVCVADVGIGIPTELQSKVFERFFRVTNPGIQTYPGMGLGLYISAGIIQRHDGTISVTSEPGKGSEFCFSIPYAESSSKATR